MKSSSHRLFILLLISGAFAIIGTSCNTTRGIGRDVKHVGNHIENAAN